MTNKTLPFLLAACLCTTAFCTTAAQEFDFEDIDSLLEENTLIDVSNRYGAVLQNYLPERAARRGYSSAADQLNVRTTAEQNHAQSALQNVQEKIKDMHIKNLPPAKQADFSLLQNALYGDLRHSAPERLTNDPLYYTEAFDALYDIYLDESLPPARKRDALTARMGALTDTAAQAEKNLSMPAPFLAQLAMEKAYYAHLSLDELGDFLAQDPQNDDTARAQAKQHTQQAKHAVKRMFDLFKRLSQAESGQDFRLGEKAYTGLLAQQYQITDAPAKLVKQLEANTRAARQQLSAALEPFLAQTETSTEITLQDNNAEPQTTDKPAPVKKKKTKKTKPVLRNAQDFYAVANRVFNAQNESNYPAALERQAKAWADLLAQKNVLPPPTQAFAVQPLPQYYAYNRAFLLYPSYVGGTPKFLLRLPKGNALARKEQLKRDFNTPALKLLTAKQLLPGGYYQNTAGKNWPTLRKAYPSATTANGWQEYAAELAKEQNLLVTDEDLAYQAWDMYRRTLAAELDVKLQTKRLSYANALNYLVKENGFEQADAENMLKELAQNPGEALSRQYGLATWWNAREKFRKKLGKKFNLADFHKKALQVGNVPPAELEKEISRLYEKDKKKKK